MFFAMIRLSLFANCLPIETGQQRCYLLQCLHFKEIVPRSQRRNSLGYKAGKRLADLCLKGAGKEFTITSCCCCFQNKHSKTMKAKDLQSQINPSNFSQAEGNIKPSWSLLILSSLFFLGQFQLMNFSPHYGSCIPICLHNTQFLTGLLSLAIFSCWVALNIFIF